MLKGIKSKKESRTGRNKEADEIKDKYRQIDRRIWPE
jgi:hypothetical protein